MELKDRNAKDEKGNLISQIESKPGVYLQYDNAKNEMNEILLEFDNILSKEKKNSNALLFNTITLKILNTNLKFLKKLLNIIAIL